MTASFVQVRPLGVAFPTTSPPPRDPVQVLRARRCLFGAADPDETARLFREEERANLEYLQQTYQIVDVIAETPMVPDHINSSPSTEVVMRDSESEVAENLRDNTSLVETEMIHRADEKQQSMNGAIFKNLSPCGKLQRNPGALRTFPVRKHPYAFPSKQSRINARNGNPEQQAPSHHM